MRNLLTAVACGEQYARLRFRSALILFCLILVLGNLPGARADIGHFASGLVLHSTAYSVITYLLFSGSSERPKRRAVAAILMVAGMGALDEFVQSFFPYRGASIDDWLVDVAASLCVSALLLAWFPFPRQNNVVPSGDQSR